MDAVTRSHRSRLLRLATSLGARDEDAEDVVQEALLRYWKRMQQNPHDAPPENPYALLAVMVRKVWAENVRYDKRRRSRVTRFGGAVSNFTATHISSPLISAVRRWVLPDALLEREQVNPVLLRGLRQLTPRLLQVFWLVAIDEHEYDEVGRMLRLERDTVRRAMSRAVAHMRRCVERAALAPAEGARAVARYGAGHDAATLPASLPEAR